MKLEIGMYVRTEKGQIYIVEEVLGDKYYSGLLNGVIDVYGQRLITKASFNLIDLIEVGDYVNGQQVIYNDNEQEYGYFQVDDRPFIEATFYILNGTIIKSILTHEQYEANCYKVGE